MRDQIHYATTLKEGLGEIAYQNIKAKTEQQTPLKQTTTAFDIAEAIVMLLERTELNDGGIYCGGWWQTFKLIIFLFI